MREQLHDWIADKGLTVLNSSCTRASAKRTKNCPGYYGGFSKQVPHLLMENTRLNWLRSPDNPHLHPSHQILLEADSEKKLKENGLEDLHVGL